MKLLMNTSPFRLEQGYELGFGPSVFDTMAEVILAFREPWQDILFSYTNWDREFDPHRENLIEDSVHCFHADMIYDPNQTICLRVKEILLHHYAPESDLRTNEALMDQMLARFREVPLDELDDELLRKIGTAVHEMNSFYTLEDRDEATQTFVKNRLVETTSSTWLYPFERPVNLKNQLWYRVNTIEEILRSFELTSWMFACVIVNRNARVEDYCYLLDYTEEHGDEHDGMVLYMSAKWPELSKMTFFRSCKSCWAISSKSSNRPSLVRLLDSKSYELECKPLHMF
ncbi:hypothetical protein [Brevibacillus brevis]|uniref:hypothetical protein n=1 Tax=Brevibacillus brevis TaxID=1393 RepID=UPI000D10290F|nr:hypothetical protein [Brevibacillus brevis]PSJ67846.1 hypothetical protein C7J99_18705 [Brevibacillus brevis]RED22890.1 hypothetical protein DES34_11699 [Brevibacillus brevis]GEC91330.1 hypothetical protein BBR01nite_36610 [Brevibacillus brevis]VEF87763.1 Uncharacterised protein [Brevibacillus brevis]